MPGLFVPIAKQFFVTTTGTVSAAAADDADDVQQSVDAWQQARFGHMSVDRMGRQQRYTLLLLLLLSRQRRLYHNHYTPSNLPRRRSAQLEFGICIFRTRGQTPTATSLGTLHLQQY